MIAVGPNRRRRGGVAVVVVAWLAVLTLTIGLGVLGRGSGDRPNVAVVPTASPILPSVAPSPTGLATPRRAPPRPTRPPIGEDGVMGGLPFGTAFLWLHETGRVRRPQ